MEPIIIYCTVPDKNEAKEIAKTLVQKKLAACVSIVDKLNSVFSWDGKICEETEFLLMIKTSRELFGRIKPLIEEMHMYNIPEIIAIPIIAGSEDYINWIEHEIS